MRKNVDIEKNKEKECWYASMLTHRQVDKPRNKKQVKTKWRDRERRGGWILQEQHHCHLDSPHRQKYFKKKKTLKCEKLLNHSRWDWMKKWHQWNVLSFCPKSVEEALCSVRFFITPRLDDYGARRTISTCSHVTHLGRHAPPPRGPWRCTRDFGGAFSILFHFEWFKIFVGAPSHSLQIIFAMQSQRSSHKRAESTFFFNCKMCFLCFFLHFDLSYFITK